MRRGQTEEQIPVNSALLNVVTPMGLEFQKNRLSVGENLGKIYGIIRYPQKVDVEWLSKLTNIPSTLVSIGFHPVDNGTLINAISKSVVQQRGLADGAKDPLSRQRAEKAAEDGEKVIMQIDREGETVGLMSVEVMPVAKDEKEFKKACRRAESVASVMKCKMRVIPNLQKEAFMHLSPTFPNNPKMESILQKVVPFSTFVGGFPFSSSGFNDGEGYYFAKDTSGGLVIVDTWKRGGDRTNSNFCVMGNSGVGKSTAIKHILLAEYMKGTKIIVIDPESEYKDMCLNLKGDWINAVGGSKGMINPLQVRPSPKDDENEAEENRLYHDEGYGMNDLALHMKNLEILYEDNHIIAINKKVSDIVQADQTGDEPLSERVKAYIKEKYNKPGDVYLGIPHRVDRPVSGVVLFAKTSKALVRLNKMFQEHDQEITKIYWAIVGNLPEEDHAKLTHYMVRDAEKLA